MVTLDQLDNDKVIWLFQSLANFTKPPSEGGIIDIFCPLAASGSTPLMAFHSIYWHLGIVCVWSYLLITSYSLLLQDEADTFCSICQHVYIVCIWSCLLVNSEPGTEMLIQLNILTGQKFSAPTGVSGQWNRCEEASLSLFSPILL